MRSEQARCETDRLKLLLKGDLPEAEATAVEDHLGDCPHCRETLEALASDRGWWSELPRIAQPETHSTKPGPIDEVPPGFLEPSTRPGMLGRLGPYEVESVIGRGGMGLVLRGFDPALNRPVAIKVISPQLASLATARRRFTREARAAAAISHDHVIAIHAVAESSSGLPYLVMPIITGRSLQRRLDEEGPLDTTDLLRIGYQTASGLAAAHAQGVVHRDIKPANLLLENGVERVKITDFGLARAADDASASQSGWIAGTPSFMAPEQAKGELVDPRADQFSLGAVLYATATGHSPFRAPSTLAVMKRVCEDRPRPIRQINTEIPNWLEAIIFRLLEKSPANRFSSMSEVAELLRQGLTALEQPGSVTPPRLGSRGRSIPGSGKRRVTPLFCAGLLGLAGVGVLGGAILNPLTGLLANIIKFRMPEGTLIVELDDPTIEVEIDDRQLVLQGPGVQQIRLDVGPHLVRANRDGAKVHEEVVTISRDQKRVVAVRVEPKRTESKRRPARGTNPLERSESVLPQPSKPPIEPFGPFPDDPRAEQESTALFKPRPPQVPRPEQELLPPPDLESKPIPGSLLAPDPLMPLPKATEVPNGPPAPIRPPANGLLGPALPMPSERLTSPEAKPFTQYPTPSESPASISSPKPDLSMAASSRRLPPRGRNITVRLKPTIDVHDSFLLEPFPGSRCSFATYSPDSKYLAVGTSLTGEIHLYDMANLKRVQNFHGEPPLGLVYGAISSRTEFLATTRGNLIDIWNINQGKFVCTIDAHEKPIRSIAFSPNGQLLASASDDKTVKFWKVRTWSPEVIAVGYRPTGVLSLSGIPSQIRFGANGHLAIGLGSENSNKSQYFAEMYKFAFNNRIEPLRATHPTNLELLCLALSHEGFLAMGHSKPWIEVWGEEARYNHGGLLTNKSTGPNTLTFTNNRNRVELAAAYPDGTIQIWDLGAQKLLYRLEGHRDRIDALEASPDGTTLASASRDGTVRIWDLTELDGRTMLQSPLTNASMPVKE